MEVITDSSNLLGSIATVLALGSFVIALILWCYNLKNMVDKNTRLITENTTHLSMVDIKVDGVKSETDKIPRLMQGHDTTHALIREGNEVSRESIQAIQGLNNTVQSLNNTVLIVNGHGRRNED